MLFVFEFEAAKRMETTVPFLSQRAFDISPERTEKVFFKKYAKNHLCDLFSAHPFHTSVNQLRADSFQPFVASCLWIHALPKLKSAGASTPRHNLAVSVANSNYRSSWGTLAAGY